MKPKVAVFLPSLAGGGAERAMLNLARGFAEIGPVDLVLGRAEGPLLDQVSPDVSVVDLRARRTLLATIPLARYLTAVRPAGLVSALTHANVTAILACRLARTKTRVAVSEQVHASAEVRSSPRRADRCLPFLLRRVLPWAHAVTAVSQGAADDLADFAGLSRTIVKVVHNPILDEELRHRASEPHNHPWLGNDHGPVVVSAGRLTSQKDFPTLLRAVRLLGDRQVKAIIMGEGEQRPALQALVHELGLADDVQLAGFFPNPHPIIAAADVFVLSSRWEGLPTVLMEAAALRVPIVATDCPSGPAEILRDDRRGTLVPVGDPVSLAEAIAATIDRPAKPPGLGDDYHLDRVVDRYLELLHLER